MGWSLRARVRSLSLAVLVASCVIDLLGVLESNTQTFYNINFNQFAPGTSYTNASGPPADFSSYAPSGLNAGGVSAYVFPGFYNQSD